MVSDPTMIRLEVFGQELEVCVNLYVANDNDPYY